MKRAAFRLLITGFVVLALSSTPRSGAALLDCFGMLEVCNTHCLTDSDVTRCAQACGYTYRACEAYNRE